MSFDADAIALAARFAPGVVSAPAGYEPVRVSTADLPGQMTPLPAVLVYLEGGEWEHFPGKRDGIHRYIVRFYYNQIGDLERDMVALRKWLDVLAYQLEGSAQLGGQVSSAHIDSWQIGRLSYAGVEYSGIQLGVEIVTNEPWSPVS